jgi:hypothetical protein
MKKIYNPLSVGRVTGHVLVTNMGIDWLRKDIFLLDNRCKKY